MGLVSGMEGPEQFLWRGRLWKVRAVLAHWVETGPWWQSGSARAVIGSDEPAADRRSSLSRPPVTDLLAERELWRVEAGRGATARRAGDPTSGAPNSGAPNSGAPTSGAPTSGDRGSDAVPAVSDGPAVPAVTDVPDGGVFDLAFDWSNGRWALVGCVD
jgi:hypothetical protein